MAKFRRLFRFPWRTRQQIDEDVVAEVRFHLEMRTQELIDQGRDPAQAREEAQQQFGNVDEARRGLLRVDGRMERQTRRLRLLDEFRQDIRYGLRTLAKQPGFTSVAVLTVALGIGATTTLFSVVNAVLLRPLPYPDAERLVRVYQQMPMLGQGPPMLPLLTNDTLEAWRDDSQALEQIAGYFPQTYTLIQEGEPFRIRGAGCSNNFFRIC